MIKSKLPLEEPLPAGKYLPETKWLDMCPCCGEKDVESSPYVRAVCIRCYSHFNKSNFLLFEEWLTRRLTQKKYKKTKEQQERSNELRRIRKANLISQRECLLEEMKEALDLL